MYPFINRYDLQNVLRYIQPRNVEMYQTVFVHKSALKRLNNVQEGDMRHESNERLEFLGDVVFGIAVTDYLYTRFPSENEGFLTKMRIRIVKGPSLAKFARHLGLEKHMVLSNNTSVNENILENAFEALVGAIYLDYRCIGHENLLVREFVSMLLHEVIDWNDAIRDDNYKDVLMRYVQKMQHGPMNYNVCESRDSNNSPLYNVVLTVKTKGGDTIKVSKNSKTKKNGEQECAKNVLEILNPSPEVYLIR